MIVLNQKKTIKLILWYYSDKSAKRRLQYHHIRYYKVLFCVKPKEKNDLPIRGSCRLFEQTFIKRTLIKIDNRYKYQ